MVSHAVVDQHGVADAGHRDHLEPVAGELAQRDDDRPPFTGGVPSHGIRRLCTASPGTAGQDHRTSRTMLGSAYPRRFQAEHCPTPSPTPRRKLIYGSVVAYVGSRTKTVGTWLLPEDEDTFDVALRDRFPDAAWRCSKPGPLGLHPIHLHRTLANAMACAEHGVQAFLALPIGASLPATVELADGLAPPSGPPSAASIQISRAHRYHEAGGTCNHGIEYRHPDGDVFFEAGRLATRWYEDEVGPDMHEVLGQQARAVWSVLTATTRPAHVVDQNGRRLTGYRIGAAAAVMAKATDMLLSRPGRQRFRLL